MKTDTIDIIRQLCADRGISIRQLEMTLEFGNGTLARANNIKADRLYQIANYFGVPMEYLMTGINTNSFYGRILNLCAKEQISIEELEKELSVSPGVSSTWKLNLPSEALLKKIADYFRVSTDYLLSGTSSEWNPTLTAKDEKDIAKRLENTLDELMSSQEGLMFSGEPLDDETRELLVASLENSMRIAKINAKQKFTPNKYRK